MMMDTHNTSNESHSGESNNINNNNNSSSDMSNNNGNNNGNNKQDSKRQQFTNKQRMDMYAFCVVELEMHSNKVSIKKQQQAIQKVLYGQKGGQILNRFTPVINETLNQPPQHQLQGQQPLTLPPQPTHSLTQAPQQDLHHPQLHQLQQLQEPQQPQQPQQQTLLELQQEVALTRKCYSDYQRTQVLTSAMLRDVQKRFAKYYPEAAIPSRTTIKHVFEKCVAHGTVENMKVRRKMTKLPQGDEIEYLLIHEPQLSLRQLAQKLNVSTGTISRRCKALGLVPESVTIKHQQLATARRQKQMKQLENQTKATSQEEDLSAVKNETFG